MFIWPFDEKHMVMKHNLVSQEPSDEGRSYTSPLLLHTEAQVTVTLPGLYSGWSDSCRLLHYTTWEAWGSNVLALCVWYHSTSQTVEYIPCGGTDQVKLQFLCNVTLPLGTMSILDTNTKSLPTAVSPISARYLSFYTQCWHFPNPSMNQINSLNR